MGTRDDDFTALMGRLVQPESRELVVVEGGERRSFHRVLLAPTGRVTTRSVQVGRETYTAEVPELAGHRTHSADSLESLAELLEAELSAARGEEDERSAREWDEYRLREAERSEVLRERDAALRAAAGGWAEGVRARAAERLAVRDGAVEPVVCGNCRGAGGFEVECECVRGERLVHLGLLAEEGDAVTGQTPAGEVVLEGEPCERCSGNGRTWQPCPYCGGSARAAATTQLVLVDELTGLEEVLELDVEMLLGDGGAELEVLVASYPQWGSAGVVVDLPGALEVALGRMGTTIEASRPVTSRFGVGEWWALAQPVRLNVEHRVVTSDGEPWPFEGASGEAHYRQVEERLPVGPPLTAAGLAEVLPGADAVLDALVASLAHSMAWVPARGEGDPDTLDQRARAQGFVLDEEGMVRQRRVTVRVVGTAPETLDALVELAADAGYGVALGNGFIATGETGPRVLLTSSRGEPLAELGLAYDWGTALASARAALVELLASGQLG